VSGRNPLWPKVHQARSCVSQARPSCVSGQDFQRPRQGQVTAADHWCDRQRQAAELCADSIRWHSGARPSGRQRYCRSGMFTTPIWNGLRLRPSRGFAAASGWFEKEHQKQGCEERPAGRCRKQHETCVRDCICDCVYIYPYMPARKPQRSACCISVKLLVVSVPSPIQ
jgi:hypothetical protein